MSGRRKARHAISVLLIFVLTVCFTVFVLAAVFYFGVFSQSVLTRCFGQSGYYARQCEALEQKVRQHMEEAALSESLLDPSQYGPALERRMRSQVYGRNDAVLELNPLSLAEDMLRSLGEQGMEPTLHSSEGILKLTNHISGLFEAGTEIPEIAKWRQEKQVFSEKFSVFVVVLTAMTLVPLVVLYRIQSRKYKFFYYLSLSLMLASLAGVLGSFGMFGDVEAGWRDQGVASWYRKEILLTGIKVSTGICLAGITGLLCGQILKKNATKE